MSSISVASKNPYTSIELCAGAGGQALGLEQAGFQHECLVELDGDCCQTLRYNRPNWNVVQADLNSWEPPQPVRSKIDLLAAGLPCPPFSVAGKQLGRNDERDLFPAAYRIIQGLAPKAVMIENVKGFLDRRFDRYREGFLARLRALGYEADIRLLNASDYGVPQLRPRVIIVAMQADVWEHFSWPLPYSDSPPTVGEVLYDLMASGGWRGAEQWKQAANAIAPTIVGGSKKHGGPDLGPTRAKKAWERLSVNGHSIAETPPSADFEGLPRLTVAMVALLQGFPKDWTFCGRRTSAYRQVGNAFPPPVARAVGAKIHRALLLARHNRIAI